MRSLGTVPVLLLGMAFTAPAQHGGAAGGVHAGSGGAVGLRGGFAPAPRPAGAPAYGIGMRGSVARPAGRQLFPPPGITSTRPVYDTNGIRRYGEPGGRRYRGDRVGYGEVGYGLLGAGYAYPAFGYGDLGFDYADSDAFDPLDPNNQVPYPQRTAQDAFPAAEASLTPGAAAPSAAEDGAYTAVPQEEPPSPYASYAVPPTSRPATPPNAQHGAPPPEEEAVTIIFKDGRPNEQIRNYALTRMTLLVTGAHTRSIPVDQIDLAATEKVNEQAGVDFHLPDAK